MTHAEQIRMHVLNQSLEWHWTAAEKAEVLSLPVRHVRRLLAAEPSRTQTEDGVAAMVHGNRGRSPAHALPAALLVQLIELAQARDAGCDEQHMTELLAGREGILRSRSSLLRILRAAGIMSPRAPTYR